jgi:broad specificity phosphatase PhoE
VLLVRHGQTDDNREPIRVQGFTDTPLNDVGRRQAAEVAERLQRTVDVRSLWASDLSRARETAEAIGARMGLVARLDPRLREASRGRWEGQRFIDIAEAEPDLYRAWRDRPGSFRFPEGESLREQQERVSAAVEDIRTEGPLPAVVVCHGGSIRVMLCLHHPRGLEAFHEFAVPNVAVVAV